MQFEDKYVLKIEDVCFLYNSVCILLVNASLKLQVINAWVQIYGVQLQFETQFASSCLKLCFGHDDTMFIQWYQ